MDPSTIPIWKVLGSMWPLYVAIIALLWFTGTLGGLAGIVAHGATAVANFGVNFLARTVAFGVALGVVLLAVVVFKSIGVPSISSYFPTSATTAPSVSAPPSAVAPGTP